MKTYSFYHRGTGILHSSKLMTTVDSSAHLEAHTPLDHVVIDGELDHLSQRVDLSGDTPRIVDYQPPQPSSEHEWNAQTKRWQLSAGASARETRRAENERRIAELRTSQHDHVRRFILGRGGSEELRAIDAEIDALSAELSQ